MEGLIKLLGLGAFFGAPLVFVIQLLIAIPIYPACKRKGLPPKMWTFLSLIPFIGIAVTVHILAKKDI